MPRSTTGLAYATLGLSVLAGLTFVIFVSVPAWTEFRAANARLEKQRLSLEEHQQFLANVDARAAELKQHEKDAKVLAVAFPESSAAADITALLASLAQREGLSVTSVMGPVPRQNALAGTTPENQPGGREIFETTVRVRGTYAGISGFLRGLEQSARLVNIPSIDMSLGGQGAGIEGTVTLQTLAIPARHQGSLPMVSTTPVAPTANARSLPGTDTFSQP